MSKSPVLFVVFNRPDCTKKVFERIRQHKPDALYISADGPRKNISSDDSNCRAVREIVSHVDWDCKVSYNISEKNLGCKVAVSNALSWFFEQEEAGIILEDDCLPDLSFFSFCHNLLEYHKNNEKIFSISGCNLGFNDRIEHSYSYSRFMNMWGWATWRRSAELIDYSMSDWKERKNKFMFLHQLLRKNLLDPDFLWTQLWVNKFHALAAGNIDTWDYQWIYYSIINSRYAVFPKCNLVKNLGFARDATHTVNADSPLADLATFSMPANLLHPPALEENIPFLEEKVKRIWANHPQFSLKTQLGFLFHKLTKERSHDVS